MHAPNGSVPEFEVHCELMQVMKEALVMPILLLPVEKLVVGTIYPACTYVQSVDVIFVQCNDHSSHMHPAVSECYDPAVCGWYDSCQACTFEWELSRFCPSRVHWPI